MAWLVVVILMFALLVLAFLLADEILTAWLSCCALAVGLAYLIIKYRNQR